ncbi:MAG: FAD/NAD(P)-binding protein [Solirubrobacterales bacterium]
MPARSTVAIIGGGASGTLLATQLLRRMHPEGMRVVLVERRPRIGPGLAYSTPYPFHRLNVPTGQMGSFPRDPGHFLRWARRGDPEVKAGDFLPRSSYGAYLAEVLANAERRALAGAGLERCHDEALAVRAGEGTRALRIELASGTALDADRLVLALGNPPPAVPGGAGAALLGSGRFHADPWDTRIAAAAAGDRSVLLIGTGLTMVDVALVLAKSDRAIRICAVSRNGLLPRSHLAGAARPEETFDLPPGPFTLDELIAAVESEIASVEAAGGDWRSVIDSLRPVTNRIWQRLGDEDRRRFVREVARHWEVRRHRMAPEVAVMLNELLSSGQLEIERGEIVQIRAGAGGLLVSVRDPGTGEVSERPFDRAVNCTGPAQDLSRTPDPVIASLLEAGEVRPGPYRLGLDHDSRGAMITGSGEVSSLIFGIGPVRKGRLWETTAIPEIREQALELADLLTADLSRLVNRRAAPRSRAGPAPAPRRS